MMLGLIHAPSGPFEPPTRLYHLLTRPLHFLVYYAHHLLNLLRGQPNQSKPRVRVVCLSDTHTHTLPVPAGDVLIHAGDMGVVGTAEEIQKQIDWLSSLPHAHKIVVCGNHDGYLDPRSRRVLNEESKTLDWKGITYLQHSTATIRVKVAESAKNSGERTLRIYGAPQIPACGGPDNAFQYPRGQDAWTDTIPADTDILVTHTPPKWHRDLPWGQGCEWLLKEVWRVQPLLHVCAHIHGGRGLEHVYWDNSERNYERICENAQGWGFLFSPGLWIAAVKVVGYGVSGILWNRIYGGTTNGSTIVNAGVVDWQGKKVIHKPIVVDL